VIEDLALVPGALITHLMLEHGVCQSVVCVYFVLFVCCSYGLRYTAKVLRDSLKVKFPSASEDELYKVSAVTEEGEGLINDQEHETKM